MKRLLCIVLCMLFCITGFAEEKRIRLEKGDKDKDRRTLVWEPTAAIDGDNIILYSDVTMEMTVSIYDASNRLVQTLTVTCFDEASFDLLQTLSGEYRIEISCGEDFYYGYFVLN